MKQYLRVLLQKLFVGTLLFISVVLLGCSGAINDSSVTPDMSEVQVDFAPELTVVEIATAEQPTPQSTTAPTPLTNYTNGPPQGNGAHYDSVPSLPEIFFPDSMKPGVSPVAYLNNPCQYLENRLGEEKSTPGTVVVPIMFHSIVQPDRPINDTTSITIAYFEKFMETAAELGFSTITTQELVDFLDHNQAIPERSMLLILDDRRPGVTELFMPYLEDMDWTLTLGWIAADSTRDSVWETMTDLASTGRLDVQSHGYNHIYIQDYISTAQIEEELYKPIEVIEARFGTRPIAHVWPGGNFDERAIAMATEAGYQVGFTVYSRGPIMYNWIPLGEPEMAMAAPLMVLPRFWSTVAVQALEEAVMVSEAAKKFYSAIETAEREYYLYYCLPEGSH